MKSCQQGYIREGLAGRRAPTAHRVPCLTASNRRAIPSLAMNHLRRRKKLNKDSTGKARLHMRCAWGQRHSFCRQLSKRALHRVTPGSLGGNMDVSGRMHRNVQSASSPMHKAYIPTYPPTCQHYTYLHTYLSTYLHTCAHTHTSRFACVCACIHTFSGS